ncbi:MAG: uncharacterized protein K0R38_2204 [Polyangiaceae bacterium]|jgi:hypothetical protein|nr:uncharacterized protein [Polyangiaceae bacterium]
MTIEALCAELETKIVALSRRCIEAMYEDPFWMARFGERGRKHAEEDSEYHVKYIVAALRGSDAAVFENYARWLRSVLASRGMCSWHLAQSFWQLAQAMRAEQIAEAEPALSVLGVGRAALDYTIGNAAPIAAHAAELRAAVGDDAYRLEELWSFLLDAVDRDDAPAFRAHVDFVERALVQDDAERLRLARTLSALQSLAAMHAPAELPERLFSAQ